MINMNFIRVKVIYEFTIVCRYLSIVFKQKPNHRWFIYQLIPECYAGNGFFLGIDRKQGNFGDVVD